MSPSPSDTDAVPVASTFPEPHVRWYPPDRFEAEFGYPPGDPTSVVREEVIEEVNSNDPIIHSQTRVEALHRLARLWNGETVGPDDVHLIYDKAPAWCELFGDLDQRYLRPLRPTSVEPDKEFLEAFGDRDWCNPQTARPSWLKTVYIARSRADYAPERGTRKLLNEHQRFPALRGDPLEGLVHRFGVGLEATRATLLEDRDVRTYVDLEGYTPDLLEYDIERGVDVVGEVLTDHHDNKLYRSTMRKLLALGKPAILIFDDWSTARRVFNHWHDRVVDVPGAPFQSSLRTDWVRAKFQEAADDPSGAWPVEDVLTLSSMWRLVFEDGPAPPRHEVISVDW